MLIIFVKKNNDKLDRFLKKQLHKNFWQGINNKKKPPTVILADPLAAD